MLKFLHQFNNLDVSSVALVFQLRAIDKRRIKNKLGELKQDKLEILKQSLIKIMELI